MKCPKCGYVSFEYLDTCKKCSKDLFEFKEKAGILVLEPAYLDLNRFIEDQGAGETGGTELEDLEYDGETEFIEDVSDESTPAVAKDVLDSLEMGDEEEALIEEVRQEEGAEPVQTPESPEGPDLTGGEDLLGSLDVGGDEISTDAGAQDDDMLSEVSALEVGEEGGAEPVQTQESPEGPDLTGDVDLLDSLNGGGDETGKAINVQEEDIEFDQEQELEIDLMEEEGESSPGAGEESRSEKSGAEGGIEFSLEPEGEEEPDKADLDMTEDIPDADEDITGEIDLMLEDVEDLNP